MLKKEKRRKEEIERGREGECEHREQQRLMQAGGRRRKEREG